MEVYIIMFIIAVFFAILASKQPNKNKKLIYTLLAFLPIIIVSSIRYDVGTDYMYRNVPDYQNMVLGKDIENLEPLFKLIMKICIFFSKDYVILFVVTSIITYTLICITIYKNSKNILLSVLVFILGTYFFQSLNLIRQFIGIAIMFYAYRYILDKKYIKWFICLALATMIHTSCIIFIITLFFDKKVFKIQYLVILSVLMLLFGDTLLKAVLSILGKSTNLNIKKYQAYILFAERGLNLSSFIPELLIYLYFYAVYHDKKDEIGKEGTYFLNLQFFATLCVLMNIFNSLFYRILVMFAIFQILSIPYFWNLCRSSSKKINLRKTVISINTLCCIFIMCILTTKMVYSHIIKGNADVLPYKTIWERD